MGRRELAAITTPAKVTVGRLCWGIARDFTSDDVQICAYRAVFEGRALDYNQSLDQAGLKNDSVLDVVRCPLALVSTEELQPRLAQFGFAWHCFNNGANPVCVVEC